MRAESFHPLHLEDLRKSGLSDETIKKAGIKTIPPNEINKKIGFNILSLISCYEIPYDKTFSRFRAFYDDNNTNGKHPLTGRYTIEETSLIELMKGGKGGRQVRCL